MLVILAVVMFGPEKLPGIARKAGRIFRYLNGIANDAKGQLRAELGPEWDDIKLSDLNPKTFVQRHLLDAGEVAAVRDAIAETKQVLDESSETLAGASAGLADSMRDTAVPALVRVPYDSEAT